MSPSEVLTSASPPEAGADSARALASDHWSTLPAAPIPIRSGAAGVWTGKQFIVWGGAAGTNSDEVRGDGAAYDPGARRWTTLPAAPISARTGMASLWTGSDLFVWGGEDRVSDPGHTVNDGALYDPATAKWQKLPPSPLSARAYATAMWLDGKVIVMGGQPVPTTSTQGQFTDLAAYDPATNAWSKLAPMPLSEAHVLGLVAVAVGDRVYAWQLWQQVVPDPVASGEGSGESISSGIYLDIFDPARNTWTADPSASRPVDDSDRNNAPPGVERAFSTGTDIVVPAAQPFCGDCKGPWVSGQQGRLLDVAANTWTLLPHGPVDDLEPNVLYTGATMLAFDTNASTSGPDGNHFPGEAAVWDPMSDRWTPLPAAPLASGGNAVAVWAGDRLLEWGLFSLPTAPNAGEAPSSTDGLSFGP
jgi:Galactose oxidase, central domain